MVIIQKYCVLYRFGSELVEVLCDIITDVMINSYDDWKDALLVIIFKKSNKKA